MKHFFLALSIFNMFFLNYSLNPIFLGILLLNQTFIVCLTTRMMFNSSWLSCTIFLVMAGGLMILFVYMTSICSNKKPNLMKNKFYKIIPLISCIFFFQIMLTKSKENFQLMDMFHMEFINLFLPMNILASNFMFIYLLITLIVMVEILSQIKGPMRKKY